MAQPLVRTRYGTVEGYEEDGVHCFLGIPYAKPPVGALRFAAAAVRTLAGRPCRQSALATVRHSTSPRPASRQ